MTVTVACPDGSTQVVPFCIYIDPSGTVQTPDGTPIAGATVTILMAASQLGPFNPLPDGSQMLDPGTTNNPEITDTTGHFDWNSKPGYYEVEAQKAGCTTQTSPPLPIAVTPVLPIPPPVNDLVLTLDCSGSTGAVITSADAATFTAGTASTFTVAATGSPTPTLSETGALPAGVTFTDDANGTATIAVAATARAGITYLTITAANGAGPAAQQAFPLTIGAGPPAPAITSSPFAGFVGGSVGTFLVTATGTPTPKLSESGTLPAGVTFVDNANGTATISARRGPPWGRRRSRSPPPTA